MMLDIKERERCQDIANRINRGIVNGASRDAAPLTPEMRANDFAAMAELWPRVWQRLTELETRTPNSETPQSDPAEKKQ